MKLVAYMVVPTMLTKVKDAMDILNKQAEDLAAKHRLELDGPPNMEPYAEMAGHTLVAWDLKAAH